MVARAEESTFYLPQATSPEVSPVAHRVSRKRMAVAFAVAAASDVAGFWADFVPPIQWALDFGTAFSLFLLLGRRWALLPGLVAEAIPGMGIFPVWVLVVLSLAVYDDIKLRAR